MLGPLVALIGGLDVPDISFERVTTAADSHLCEVADCVFCFREAWNEEERRILVRNKFNSKQLHVEQ